MGYYWRNMMDGWNNYGLFGGLMMILFLILIIVVIVWFVRNFGEPIGKGEGSFTREKSPLDILKERYAKGEIDKKEFEDKKKDLS